MRQASLALALAWCVATTLAAQGPEPEVAPPVVAAAEAWLASDQSDTAQKERAVKAILADTPRSLPWLGELLRSGSTDAADPSRKGKTALAADVVLGFVEQTRRSGVVYRGQYAPLSALQPLALELLYEWLLRTPDWLPDTQRQNLVPAIADLQQGQPAPELLLGVTDLIENEEIEPFELRFRLSCLVYEWGRKEYIDARLASLRQQSMEGDAEDRTLAYRDLADVYYRIRDYKKAAAMHGVLASLADGIRFELSPTDWYWGACYNALACKIEPAFAAFERCVALQASDRVDSSRKLPRKLFEQDPELAALRADERFLPMLERAFPNPPEAAKDR